MAATSGLESLDLPLRSRFKEVAIGIPNEKARKKIIEIGKETKMFFSPPDSAKVKNLVKWQQNLKISSNGNKIFKNLVRWQQDF